MALKFCTSAVKWLKLKVRKVLGLIPMFLEVTGEKLVERGTFCSPPPLNRVNIMPEHCFDVTLATLKR